MARRDYEDDPAAPKPNSLVPSASVVVVDGASPVGAAAAHPSSASAA
ncbi:hypothetical protein P3T27_002195 [Kitasatospora sp. MAA19]|nr:hypothetical protein [Kitasatospora sp. MAA19]